MNWLWSVYNLGFSGDKSFARTLRRLTGITPKRISLYRLAFIHKSAAVKPLEDNERLEYLGDTVLNMIITDYLFSKYPYKGEGFLSEMRSKMVSRTQLNFVAGKLGLENLVEANIPDRTYSTSSMLGNALEALIGAIYLDHGYQSARQFTLKKVLNIYFDMLQLETQVINFKSLILNYSQKNNLPLEFRLIDERSSANGKVFQMGLYLNQEQLGIGEDFNKKRAEQTAARIACEKLGLLV